MQKLWAVSVLASGERLGSPANGEERVERLRGNSLSPRVWTPCRRGVVRVTGRIYAPLYVFATLG